ncbi:hypothetical protein LO771_16910 [Streptacidiphilus sp. ASG 303]|uniref:hypothetical protein n=1 Tax=Streptacidiphilus sp. ASG 303 TaxID=2896847 RepID=UPI001E5E7E43|nr:hypothetical protein [Streptacidiphilus sp. ASG 303]MCD0484026.1 hypothetical protein [Streptacidiphilus sp. ASG 303]
MRRPGPRGESDRGIHQLEGYLLWQGETAAAREQAEAFADRLPWLTGPQREDVVRVYTADRLEVSRATVRRIADRARELRHEYTARYRALRLRLLALSLLGVACAAGAAALLGLLGDPG